jgi:hypothetical protein
VDLGRLGLTSGTGLCELYRELALLGNEEGVGGALMLEFHFCARKIGLEVL